MADTDETKAAADKAAADKAAADKAAADKAAAPQAPAASPDKQQSSVAVGQAAEFTHDETVEGGRFQVRRGGKLVLVNARGEAINEDGRRTKPDGSEMTDTEILRERYQSDALMQDTLLMAEAAK